MVLVRMVGKSRRGDKGYTGDNGGGEYGKFHHKCPLDDTPPADKEKPRRSGTSCHGNVRYTLNNGHFEGSRKESVNDPKRTLTGVRRRYVWRSIFKIDEAQFMIAAGRIALYAFHL